MMATNGGASIRPGLHHHHDLGGSELGFHPATRASRERDHIDPATLLPGHHLAGLHDGEIPRLTLGGHAPCRPSRHAPWKSDAERLMLSSELSMGTQMSRSSTASRKLRTLGGGGGSSGGGGNGVGPGGEAAAGAGSSGSWASVANRVTHHGATGLPDTASLVMTSPARVGRPGTAGIKGGANLYNAVAAKMDQAKMIGGGGLGAERAVAAFNAIGQGDGPVSLCETPSLVSGSLFSAEPSITKRSLLGEPREKGEEGAEEEAPPAESEWGGDGGGETANNNLQRAATARAPTAGVVEPAAARQGPGDSSVDRVEPPKRSPYARYDLISQQFTNPITQDLWTEVGKSSVGNAPRRDPTYLAEEGLPRRLPSHVSSLEKAKAGADDAHAKHRGSPHRFEGMPEKARDLWDKSEGVAKVPLPQGYHPTYSSTQRFALLGAAPDDFQGTGRPRPCTAMTTYKASFTGLGHAGPEYGYTPRNHVHRPGTTGTDMSSIGQMAFGGSDRVLRPRTIAEGALSSSSSSSSSSWAATGGATGTGAGGGAVSFGMKSAVRDFFSGPRHDVSRGCQPPPLRALESCDARFLSEKFYVMSHANPGFGGVQSANMFHRSAPMSFNTTVPKSKF